MTINEKTKIKKIIMAANIILLAVLAMFVGWVIYFKIQDRKEENNKKTR